MNGTNWWNGARDLTNVPFTDTLPPSNYGQ